MAKHIIKYTSIHRVYAGCDDEAFAIIKKSRADLLKTLFTPWLIEPAA